MYHAGTVCTRRRARLLLCFDRPVGWKQAIRLHLIKLMRLMRSNNSHYTLIKVFNLTVVTSGVGADNPGRRRSTTRTHRRGCLTFARSGGRRWGWLQLARLARPAPAAVGCPTPTCARNRGRLHPLGTACQRCGADFSYFGSV